MVPCRGEDSILFGVAGRGDLLITWLRGGAALASAAFAADCPAASPVQHTRGEPLKVRAAREPLMLVCAPASGPGRASEFHRDLTHRFVQRENRYQGIRRESGV